jgi:arylsulfatase A-like enzyme
MKWLRIFFIFATCQFAGLAYGDKPDKDYNIVLIIIDTLRPDHLGCYGYSKNTSENIDEIAKQSFIFENAFSQAGYTLASHTSIFTSLYPRSHNVFYIYKDRLSSRVRTLPEILGLYGYRTAWSSLLNEPHLDLDSGFGRGFHDRIELDSGFNGRDQLLSWIGKNKNNKFFLAINTRKVHDYFSGKDNNTAIEEVEAAFHKVALKYLKRNKSCLKDPENFSADKELFNGKYYDGKTQKIKDLVKSEEWHKISRLRDPLFTSWIKRVIKRDTEFWIANYDACLRAVDEQLIKPLAEKLKETGLYDKTILIITADHGEAFGEHKVYGRGFWLFEELIHVPLIIKMPNAKNGRRIKELAQSIDIMPTILELVGIRVPHEAQGKSLAGSMSGIDARPPHEYIFAESPPDAAVCSNEWLFIVSKPSRKRLFHIAPDRQSHKNAYLKNRETALKLELKLAEHLLSLPSYKDREYSFPPEIDVETQERIKKTGYW